MLALVCVLALAGCERLGRLTDTESPFDTPVDWWHQLQGGMIAEDRPPPPGVSDPYPNLGQVPPRPTPTDAATRRALTARLASQRDVARREAAQDPITPIPPPAAASAPVPTGRPSGPPAAPAPPELPLATLDAASAPPRPAAPAPPPAPAAPPPPAFLAPPRPPPAAQAAAPQAAPAAPIVSGPVPALPGTPPPPPLLAGLPATTFAPATPRPRPSVSLTFIPGSAALPTGADDKLQQLAARRAGGTIQVSAGGDAAGGSVEAQAAALPLALRRAQAITDALQANAVPLAAMRVDARAPGRGGSARLIE